MIELRRLVVPLVVAACLPLACRADGARRGPPLAVPGFGTPVVWAGTAEHPDPALRYRVVFDAHLPAGRPWRVAPGLERAARFVNLLAVDGVRIRPGDVVVVVSGPATFAVLDDRAYVRRVADVDARVLAFADRLLHHGEPDLRHNPNLPLIAALRRAGVVVSVCSQALHGHHVDRREVARGVRVDVSGLTTLANLQLRGHALIPDQG
jgi:intracellular sulfur oxidation DsrE/DsrF family protein